MTNLPTETNKYGCLPCPFCNRFEAVQVQQVQVTAGANQILGLCARIVTREALGPTRSKRPLGSGTTVIPPPEQS
jgi:hypothetical protein